LVALCAVTGPLQGPAAAALVGRTTDGGEERMMLVPIRERICHPKGNANGHKSRVGVVASWSSSWTLEDRGIL
jgi:hypothetical protein